MSIIKFGTIVTAARGTIGGLILSKNKAGPYARTWSSPSNPRSPYQSSARELLALSSNAWALLTEAYREDWNTWAAQPEQERTNSLGEPYYISGFNWFIALNTNLANAGRSPIIVAPTLPRPTAPTISSLTCQPSPGTQEITFPAGTFNPGFDAHLAAVLAPTNAATAPPGKPSHLGTATEPSGTSLDLSTYLAQTFGTLVQGQRLFLYVSRMNLEGYLSTPYAVAAAVDS